MIRQEYGNPYVMPAADRAAYVKDMIARAERTASPGRCGAMAAPSASSTHFDGEPRPSPM